RSSQYGRARLFAENDSQYSVLNCAVTFRLRWLHDSQLFPHKCQTTGIIKIPRGIASFEASPTDFRLARAVDDD
ncbi:hypothetical protein, partial [Cupriavidus sp. CuC1]|uniref:hypothetical protein n=1 Tax=Cupriavidus sp. CuC1 TaxID=3373131 RepID=UPI0037D79B31